VNLKGYVSTAQAAKLAGLSPSGIIERIRRGELDGVKIPGSGPNGFRYVVKEKDVIPGHRGSPLGISKPNGSAGKALVLSDDSAHEPASGMIATRKRLNEPFDALVGRLAKRFPDLTGAALIELAEDFRK